MGSSLVSRVELLRPPPVRATESGIHQILDYLGKGKVKKTNYFGTIFCEGAPPTSLQEIINFVPLFLSFFFGGGGFKMIYM